jgi:DNA-binding GntR family transcriptional regulator
VATERRNAQHVARLRDIVDTMSRLLRAPDTDLSVWFENNMAFHSALLAPAGGAHLQRVLETLRSAIEPYIRMEVRLTGDLQQAQAEHSEILDAYAAGDAATVARLSREHAEHTMQRLLDGLGKRAADS